MDITFDITNSVLDFDKNQALVWFVFSNNEVNCEYFPITSSLKADANKWGKDRVLWFEQREIERQQILEVTNDSNI